VARRAFVEAAPPITHAGNGRIAHVSHSSPGLVNWRVRDAVTGETVVYSCERSFGGSDLRAMRRALRAVHLYGCTQRVRREGK
jgi:hypothetical protein